MVTVAVAVVVVYAVCAQGDNDPVDVVEIGSAAHKQGGVYKIKPLGIYAMIDDGELDWKVRRQGTGRGGQAKWRRSCTGRGARRWPARERRRQRGVAGLRLTARQAGRPGAQRTRESALG